MTIPDCSLLFVNNDVGMRRANSGVTLASARPATRSSFDSNWLTLISQLIETAPMLTGKVNEFQVAVQLWFGHEFRWTIVIGGH
jgi:hypothetical protein